MIIFKNKVKIEPIKERFYSKSDVECVFILYNILIFSAISLKTRLIGFFLSGPLGRDQT